MMTPPRWIGIAALTLLTVSASVPLDAKQARRGEKPSAIICDTVKGKGIPGMEMNASWHHKSKISDEELKSLRYELGCEL